MHPIARRRGALFFLVVLLAAAAPLAAQSLNATLAGIVRDSSGGVLPGVTVTARHVGTNQTRETVTDGEGRYAFPDLAIGPQEITAMLQGFQTARRTIQLSVGQNAGIESVQEFTVLTNTFSAEHGRASGGVFNIATRSGTNRLRGSLFEYHRDAALDTRNYFDAEKPPFTRNQYGGSVGGPILTDRIFFFGAYEGLRERLGQTVVEPVPSMAARRGAFLPPGAQINPAVLPYLALLPEPTVDNPAGERALYQDLMQVADDLSIVRGAHAFKTGVNLQRFDIQSESASRTRGEFTINTFNDFLLGRSRDFVGLAPGQDDTRRHHVQWLIGTYFQDDWKVRPNLTLNLGVRYEFATVPDEVDGKITNLRSPTDPAITIGAPLFQNPTLGNVSPRFGFVYVPSSPDSILGRLFGAEGQSSIRGGVGLYYDPPLFSTWGNNTSRQEPYFMSTCSASCGAKWW